MVRASDGGEGLKIALEDEFDICILDVMLPTKSGVEIAEAMRDAGCDTPILPPRSVMSRTFSEGSVQAQTTTSQNRSHQRLSSGLRYLRRHQNGRRTMTNRLSVDR